MNRPEIQSDGVKINNTKHLFVDPVFAVLKKVRRLGFEVAGKSEKDIEAMFEKMMDEESFSARWEEYVETIFGKKVAELSLDALKPSEVGRIIGNFTASDSPTPNPSDGGRTSQDSKKEKAER